MQIRARVGRERWIDSLKGFAILAVVLGHIASPLGEWIFSWHMPVFFMLSGFFVKPFQVSSLWSDVRRLMIPYFLFSGIALMVESLKRWRLDRPHLDMEHEAVGVFWTMDFNGLQNHYGYVLWFLPALLFGRMLASFLMRALSKFPFFYLVSTLFSIGLVFAGLKWELPFALDQALGAVFWVLMGWAFYQNLESFRKYQIQLSVLSAIVLFAFWIPHLNLAIKEYSAVWVNLLWGVGTFVLLWSATLCTSSLNKVHHFLGLLGRVSMLIFVLHPYTNNIAHLLAERFFPNIWILKLVVSLMILAPILVLKTRKPNWGILRYV